MACSGATQLRWNAERIQPAAASEQPRRPHRLGITSSDCKETRSATTRTTHNIRRQHRSIIAQGSLGATVFFREIQGARQARLQPFKVGFATSRRTIIHLHWKADNTRISRVIQLFLVDNSTDGDIIRAKQGVGDPDCPSQAEFLEASC